MPEGQLTVRFPGEPLTSSAILALCLGLAGPAAAQTYTASHPGLFDVRGEFTLTAPAKAAHATVLVPLVLERPEQVPLAFELSVTPPTAVATMRVRRDVGENHVVELKLVPDAAGGQIAIAWCAAVLVAPRDFSDLPDKAPMPKEWPEEARPWLAASRYAQSDAPEIVSAATELAERSTDVLQLIDRTLRRTGTIFAQQRGRCRELGALEALTKEGSCTSNANLVAALLRANGIPARIVAGYATWYGPHQTHYLVEAYVPKYGWYPLESSATKPAWPPYQQVQVSVVPVEHEGANAGRRSFAAGGVPYLSLNEYPGLPRGWKVRGTLVPGGNADHVARCGRIISDPRKQWNDALERGRAAWQAWILTASATDPTRRALSTPLATAAVLKCESLRDCARLIPR